MTTPYIAYKQAGLGDMFRDLKEGLQYQSMLQKGVSPTNPDSPLWQAGFKARSNYGIIKKKLQDKIKPRPSTLRVTDEEISMDDFGLSPEVLARINHKEASLLSSPYQLYKQANKFNKMLQSSMRSGDTGRTGRMINQFTTGNPQKAPTFSMGHQDNRNFAAMQDHIRENHGGANASLAPEHTRMLRQRGMMHSATPFSNPGASRIGDGTTPAQRLDRMRQHRVDPSSSHAGWYRANPALDSNLHGGAVAQAPAGNSLSHVRQHTLGQQAMAETSRLREREAASMRDFPRHYVS